MTTTARRRPESTTNVPGLDDHEEPDVRYHSVDVLDELQPPAQSRRQHPLRRAWLFLISMRTGLWIILVLGILTLFGTLLIQVDPGVRADPQAYQDWLDGVPRQRYGGWTAVFDTLGLFHVFSTWYFQGLFAVLSLSILACSVNRAPRLWRVATRPHTSMSDAFFRHAPLRASVDLRCDVDTAAERVRATLRAKRFRVLDGGAKDGADIYADRFRWGPFGTVVAHLSVIVILAGFVVSATTGFKDQDVMVPIGVPVEVGHGTGLVVEALSFADTYYDGGRPKDYVSDLVVTRNGTQVARQQTRVNSPLIYDGVWFHQSSFGIGADITVTQNGKTLFAKTVPLYWKSDDGQQSIGKITIPAQGLTIYVVQAASGQVLADLPAGSTLLEVHRDGIPNPVGSPVISQGQSAEVDGLTLTYQRNRQYTGLIIKQDHGSWLVWVGSALFILGCYLVFFMPHRRIWAQVRSSGESTSRVMLGAPLKRDPALEPTFDDIAHHLKTSDG